MRGFVAVHAGAGFHANETRLETASLCQAAVVAGKAYLSDRNIDCAQACTAAVSVLESSALTNAGLGSNLTLEECVECDAGLMQSNGMHFAGIGAVQTVTNPVSVAHHLLKLHADQSRNGDSSTLVLPSLLVGQGASQFAESVGLPLVQNSSLITNRARKDLQIAKDRVKKRSNRGVFLSDDVECARLDTVGAVALGSDWTTAAAVSSGGLLLKHPGRLSHAPIFGAGVWAEEDDQLSVAVSVSGCGEYLVRTHFAEKLSQELLNAARREDAIPIEVASRFFDHQFLRAKTIRDVSDERKLAGAIAILANRESQEAELIWMHNTSSLCFAYSTKSSAKFVASELSSVEKLLVSGCRITA